MCVFKWFFNYKTNTIIIVNLTAILHFREPFQRLRVLQPLTLLSAQEECLESVEKRRQKPRREYA
jgi:hypothetical protein